MNLSKDRFFKGQFNYRDKLTNDFKSLPQYSYETNNGLYDIIDARSEGGSLLVRKNCGAISPMIFDWTPIHYAILNHYGLESDKS